MEKGYSVSWATDISEKGFSLKNGLAVNPLTPYSDMDKDERSKMFDGPQDELIVTQENRQDGYDNYETTDDHGMQITGLVKDQKGTPYYIVKNSWGDRENDKRPGYIYASESFLKYKTIAILVHKDTLSKGLKEN